MPSFQSRKAQILTSLARPAQSYTDASPKGSIDSPIRPLIALINAADGWVTTSSCSGRISVWIEGGNHFGKGGGGRWAFVTHSVLDETGARALRAAVRAGGLREGDVGEGALVHLKFEPLILHVLTASAAHAQRLLALALAAGFRESGAVGLSARGQQDVEVTPVVAIRSTGLALDCVVGTASSDGVVECLVDEGYLGAMVGVLNERFARNVERMERLEGLVRAEAGGGDERVWEGKEERGKRMRREGLRKQEQIQSEHVEGGEESDDDLGLDLL